MINKIESINDFSIEIEDINKICYDKSTKIFSADLFDFKFIGLYRKSTKIRKILDEIYTLLIDLPVKRNDLFLLNLKNWKPISEKSKIKKLNLTKNDEFVFGIRFNINIIDENTERHKLFRDIFPHKIPFNMILQKFTTDVGIDSRSFELYVKEKSMAQWILFEDVDEKLFEDIISEYGNVFELRIKKIELKEEKYLVIYFENKLSPEPELVPFPVLPTSTITDLLPELSKKFNIQLQDVSMTEKYGTILSPEDYMLPIKELKEKYGDTFDIIEIHFTGGSPPPPMEKDMFVEEIKEEERKKLRKKTLPSTLSRPAGPPRSKEVSKQEVPKLASVMAPSLPERAVYKRDEIQIETEVEEIEDMLAYTLSEDQRVATPQLIRYDINMGLQYYSVMMEQCSYLFYIYFSHEELIIEDEEGKTIVKTKFTIETTKKNPPVLDVRVEGEGFEVHPLIAKLLVKKEAINPPLMIFSVLPVKSDKKDNKKKDEKHADTRFLHVLIDFEDKIISHTVLAITVQPKHFHLDLGPIHIDIGKTTATFISLISLAWAVISVIHSLISIDLSSTLFNVVGGFTPSLISVLFVVILFYTLIKGVYPLKRMWSNTLNFDKTSPISK